MTYAIVSGPTPQVVADGVNAAMKQGYKLQGGLSAVTVEAKNPLEIGGTAKVLFMQAMTKEGDAQEAELLAEIRKTMKVEGARGG